MEYSFDNFSLSLINTKKKQYETMGWWVVVLNAAVLIYVAFSPQGNPQKFFLLNGLLLPLVWLLLNRVWTKKKSSGIRDSDLTPFYIFPCFYWIVSGFYLATGILLLLFLLYKISLRPLRVRFSPQGIDYPSFPRKKIEWSQVAQVIVKDELLTIDLRSNRLMQHPVEKNSFIDTREIAAFNIHCQQKINST